MVSAFELVTSAQEIVLVKEKKCKPSWNCGKDEKW